MCLARCDQKLGADSDKLSCGGEHQLGYVAPLPGADRAHIVPQGARVHAHFETLPRSVGE
jgi:hypothetical protein